MKHQLVLLRIVSFLLSVFLGIAVMANPEFIRYQYNTCMACHVSPAGGGILSTYGRGLSVEAVSHWGSDKEAGFLGSSLDDGESDEEKQNPWYLLGGDIRAVQVHKEDKVARRGRFIPMQADVAVALQKDQFTFVFNVGEIEEDEHNWEPNINQYYLMLRPQDEITLRAGKFIPQYGLHLSDHILFIRSFLGFGLESARNAVEAQYNGENWISSLTYSQQLEVIKPESAHSVQAQYYFLDSSKIAFNYWDAKSDGTQRSLTGLWGLFSFNKEFYWLTEWDLQKNKHNSSSQSSSNQTTNITDSSVHYNKLGYTITKGLDLFLHEEFMQTDATKHNSVTTRRGLGFQFFPRPHFDISAVWTKQFTHPNTEADYAWLLLHYYL